MGMARLNKHSDAVEHTVDQYALYTLLSAVHDLAIYLEIKEFETKGTK
jgi:hypothetical protein